MSGSPSNAQSEFHVPIAGYAAQLTDNVLVVPLKDLVPVPNDNARDWFRAGRCNEELVWAAKPQDPGNLVLSFAYRDARACSVARASGRDAVRFLDLMLRLERQDCLSQKGLVRDVFSWLADNSGLETPIDTTDFFRILREAETQNCVS